MTHDDVSAWKSHAGIHYFPNHKAIKKRSRVQRAKRAWGDIIVVVDMPCFRFVSWCPWVPESVKNKWYNNNQAQWYFSLSHLCPPSRWIWLCSRMGFTYIWNKSVYCLLSGCLATVPRTFYDDRPSVLMLYLTAVFSWRMLLVFLCMCQGYGGGGVLLSLTLSVRPMKKIMFKCVDNTWLTHTVAKRNKTKLFQRMEISISYNHNSERITWEVWTGLPHFDHQDGFRKQHWVGSHGPYEPCFINGKKLNATIHWCQTLFSVSQHFRMDTGSELEALERRNEKGGLGPRSKNHSQAMQALASLGIAKERL